MLLPAYPGQHQNNNTYQSENIIEQLVKKSKKENLNIIDLLRDICNIEEVCI